MKAWFQNTQRVSRIEWLVLAALILLLAVSYIYGDILYTARQSINLWDILFAGDILDFFPLSDHTVSGNRYYPAEMAAWYDFTIYLIFAVWCFPLWAAEKLFAINPLDSFLCLIWLKLILVAFTVLVFWTLRRIADALGFSQKARSWLGFAWLTSALFVSSTVMISQYDIFSLAFMLLGYLAYVKRNTIGFVAWFALAVSCKYFALLVFVPLCLLRYKKIWKLALMCLSACVVTFAWKLLFHPAQIGDSYDFVKNSLGTFFAFRYNSGYYSFGVFFCCMFALCIWAYLRRDDGGANANLDSVFAMAAAMLAFVCTVPVNPYWCVLATPFICLLLFMNQERLKINLFLETALGLSLIVQQIFMCDWCFCNRTVMPMLFGTLLKRDVLSSDGIYNVLFWINQQYPLVTAAASIAIVSGIALLMINRPGKLRIPDDEIVVERSVFWARTLATALVGMAPIVYYAFCR